MQNDKPVDPRVADFFVQKGVKEKLAAKLVEKGIPGDRIELTWNRLVGGLAFLLAAEVLRDVDEVGKKAITDKAPGSMDIVDMSVFGEYFMAIIEEAKKWPEEKLKLSLDMVIESMTGQVIKAYQSMKK